MGGGRGAGPGPPLAVHQVGEVDLGAHGGAGRQQPAVAQDLRRLAVCNVRNVVSIADFTLPVVSNNIKRRFASVSQPRRSRAETMVCFTAFSLKADQMAIFGLLMVFFL